MVTNKIRFAGPAAAVLLVFAALLTVAALPADALAQQIDDENERGMVIDDMWYRFADNVVFYANPEKTVLANRGDFRKGTKVGYEIDENGKLSAVWLR